jgi:hypothetical protein
MKLTPQQEREKIVCRILTDGYVSTISKAKLEDIIADECDLIDDRPIRNRIKFLIRKGVIVEKGNKLFKLNLDQQITDRQITIKESVLGVET